MKYFIKLLTYWVFWVMCMYLTAVHLTDALNAYNTTGSIGFWDLFWVFFFWPPKSIKDFWGEDDEKTD